MSEDNTSQDGDPKLLSIPGYCSNLTTMIGKLEAVGHHQLFQDGANTDNGDWISTLTHPPPTAELENKGLENLMVSSNQPIVTTLIDRERNVNNLLPVEELDLRLIFLLFRLLL